MKIISNFKDYYDHSLGYIDQEGEDIYLRKTSEEVGRDIFEIPLSNAVRKGYYYDNHILSSSWFSISSSTLTEKFNIQCAVILVCGKAYPALIRYRYKTIDDVNSKYIIEDVFYNEKKFLSAYEEFKVANKLNDSPRWKYDSSETTATKAEKFFKISSGESLVDYCVDKNIVVGMVSIESRLSRQYNLTRNPCLSDLRFQKVMDGHLLYQEINMFLGRMANPSNNMVEISEKDRIVQHGFDKWSFRKMPGEKR